MLIIEDNPDGLELMSYLVESFGHVAVRTSDGLEGLAAAAAQRPDLIVCDIQLPGADGETVARRLKADAALANIPLIAVTAFAMVGDRERVLAAGFDGYLSKPIDPQRFVADLEAFLQQGARNVPVATDETPRATILVVDDVAANRELLQDTLQPFGYMVLAADCVETAMRLARKRPPDLIVSDLRMPGRDGFALLRALQGDPALAGIPCMMLSSSSRNFSDRERAEALGATCFVTRPIEPPELLERIASCLGSRT